MNNLRHGADDYLELRRGLGFKLKRHGRFVREFVSWLEISGENRITTRLALQWATHPQNLQSAEWAARLSAVRGFARYWNAIDGTSEIPADGLLPFRTGRRAPYLYSHTEIQQLLEAAIAMPAQFKFQPFTYYCLLGLLMVTGLRISEALNLESHRTISRLLAESGGARKRPLWLPLRSEIHGFMVSPVNPGKNDRCDLVINLRSIH